MKIPIKVVQTIEPNAVHLFLTVKDEFCASLVTYDEETKTEKIHANIDDGYVPSWMPGDTNCGDCVDLVIDIANGKILNWPKNGLEAVEIGKTFFPDKDDE